MCQAILRDQNVFYQNGLRLVLLRKLLINISILAVVMSTVIKR